MHLLQRILHEDLRNDQHTHVKAKPVERETVIIFFRRQFCLAYIESSIHFLVSDSSYKQYVQC